MKPRGSRSCARFKATLALSNCDCNALSWPSSDCACKASFSSATVAITSPGLDLRPFVHGAAGQNAANSRARRHDVPALDLAEHRLHVGDGALFDDKFAGPRHAGKRRAKGEGREDLN